MKEHCMLLVHRNSWLWNGILRSQSSQSLIKPLSLETNGKTRAQKKNLTSKRKKKISKFFYFTKFLYLPKFDDIMYIIFKKPVG